MTFLSLQIVVVLSVAVVRNEGGRSLRHGIPVARDAALGNVSTTELNMKAVASGMRTPQQQCNIIKEYLPEPTQCMRGHDHWSRSQLTAHVPHFLTFWANQKQRFPNHCCMGVNHMFALQFLVQTLKPAAIIESGVAAGHQTFMLRATAPPGAKIFAIDPGDPYTAYKHGGYGAWKDTYTGLTTYFTGTMFQDFSTIPWDVIIPDRKVRENTLVVLDDHQSCVARFKVMQKYGFRYAFYEDNYPFKLATSKDRNTCYNLGENISRNFDVGSFSFGDAFSPNAACGASFPKDESQFVYKDSFGSNCSVLTKTDHLGFLKWLQKNMDVYYEFPPLFTTCNTSRAPLLEPNEHILGRLGLPPVAFEIWQYGHLFPAFIDLFGVGTYKRPTSTTTTSITSTSSTTTSTTTTTSTSTTAVPSGMAIGVVNTSVTDRLVDVAKPGKQQIR
jgi:hypothetical protein